jgi:hypothetical protein
LWHTGCADTDIFERTYSTFRFYSEYGLERLRQYAKAHNPPVDDNFWEGFNLVAQGKLDQGAEQMLKYEQLDLLPKEVYTDEAFVRAVFFRYQAELGSVCTRSSASRTFL